MPLALSRLFSRTFPFLRWFPLRKDTVRTDAIAGLTVALILIPQSMAYAQLAGLPAQYGLYAAFLPVMIGALWGSSGQLSTGPTALSSLLAASALASMAVAGSESYVAYAIVLAMLVGLVRLTLGVFKLGVVVNFLSHPVVVGFTNAAAIIIALSQINKLFGVSLGRSDHFFQDIWEVAQQLGDTHLPTLLMAVLAFAIILGLKKCRAKAPNVLIAVVLTTTLSWAIGYQTYGAGKIDQIEDSDVNRLVGLYSAGQNQLSYVNQKSAEISAELRRLDRMGAAGSRLAASLNYQNDLLALERKSIEDDLRTRERAVRKLVFERVPGANNAPGTLYIQGQAPPGAQNDGHRWRIKNVSDNELVLVGGGDIVGAIPPGLPEFEVPQFGWETLTALLPSALIITLVGFMEAISIANAMAAKTRARINPNQELIGQGLANIVGSISHSFPVSGSFTRSAINLNAGALTGFSSVFSGLLVLITLLVFTPLLYHLPHATLAVIIVVAVAGLIDFRAMRHAWHAHRHDGIASAVTFLATLSFAPGIDLGILVGAGLSIILYLFRTMKPRVALLGRHPDGTLRDAKEHNLATSEFIIAMRFDGSLYFANVPYFEDAILEAVASHPKARFVLVVGEGINEIDASGEEVIRHLVLRLQETDITLVFSGIKRQVMRVMEDTKLFALIGAQHFFRTETQALDAIYQWINDKSFEAKYCPLNQKQLPRSELPMLDREPVID
ncbi:MAG: SulP family inorganic anion transporter [Burkholderiales bacterium]